jgi:hypothetical protein
MGEFHHHPDGYIYVRPDNPTKDNTYGDTLANFATDYGQPAPALPAGVTEQIYTQGVRHAYNNGGNTVGGGPMPWAWADTAITAVATILANQQARRAATPPPPIP